MVAERNRVGFPLDQLLSGLVQVPSVDAVPIEGLSADSRSVSPGDLFIACAGLRSHGLDHLPEALERGAVAVAWEPAPEVQAPGALPGVPCVPVPGLRARMGELADTFFEQPSRQLRVLGVTGTDGKSTVVHLVSSALSGEDARCGSMGTLGYGLPGELQVATHTTPDAARVHGVLAELADGGATHVAMEVSSHALDQHRVAGVRFASAAFTNLSHEHLDYHQDMATYARAKQQLFAFPGLDTVVVNLDDAYADEMLAATSARTRIGISVGPRSVSDAVDRLVFARDVVAEPGGLTMVLGSEGETEELRSRLIGRFNAHNLTLAAGILLGEGMSLAEVVAALSRVGPPAGRMEAWKLRDGVTAVVDYAHTPQALAQALAALRPHTEGRLWVVFGCGGDRDRGKRPLMGQAAEAAADAVVVTDDNPRSEDRQAIAAAILEGMERTDAVVVQLDRETAIREAVAAAEPGDVVLIAGKGHEDFQQVGDDRRPFSDRKLITELASELDGGEA